jgi:hypothetical protein
VSLHTVPQLVDLLLIACTLFRVVPHDIYHSARTRRILNSDAEDDVTSVEFERNTNLTHEQKMLRVAASTELRRAEISSLIALVVSPVAGAWLLHWLMETFSDGNRYLNTFNIRLFMLASGIKPWSVSRPVEDIL